MGLLHNAQPDGHSELADSLRQLLGVVASADRAATIAEVFSSRRSWQRAGSLAETAESAGIVLTARELDALNSAESIISWAQRERQRLSIDELSTRWRLTLGGLQHEVLEVALLDAAGRLIPDGVVRLHEGGVDRVAVEPRRIMELALRQRATALVLAHNHPSAIVKPTRRDLDGTRQIVLAGATLDVAVADHLIVSSHETFSFRQEGLL